MRHVRALGRQSCHRSQKQIPNPLLPEAEDPVELAADQRQGQPSDGVEWQPVAHLVVDDGPAILCVPEPVRVDPLAYGPFSCSSTNTSGGDHREMSVRHFIGIPFSAIR